MSKRNETEEERRVRKERERAERKLRERKEAEMAQPVITEDDKKERRHKRDETEEERRVRKERERAERKLRERKEAEMAQPVITEDDKKERRHKRDETEEERRVRKERERAERKLREQKEAESSENRNMTAKSFLPGDTAVDEAQRISRPGSKEANSSHFVLEGKKGELAAAMDAENRAISLAADEAKEAARRGEHRRAEEESEREANERREKRRKEREERKLRRAQTADSSSGIVVGKSSLDMSDLQRQGYRTQFEEDLQRAMALRRLVDMDEVSVSLVDVPPQSEYDMYIRKFGEMSRKQAGSQVPAEEDHTDAEVQAERVRLRNRGVEVPHDLGLCPEQSGDRSMNFAKETGKEDMEDKLKTNDGLINEDPLDGATSCTQIVDSTLLAAFLGRVFPVMRAILDENDEEKSGPEALKSKSETQFSTSFTTFSFQPTLNRPVVKVLFNPCAPTYVGVLYGFKEQNESPSVELDRFMSVILIWNVYDSSSPEKILVSYSLLTTFCMSPRWPHLVYAGSEDGSIYVWDTREPERNHLTAGSFQRNAFRLPSFSTSWQTGNHMSPIIAISVAGYNTVVGVRKDESEQLISIDATGGTQFWVVNERDQSKGAISGTENGLHMFSTVRLFLATSKGEDRLSSFSVNQECFAMDFVPTDSSHYVVACAEGVRHISRFGSIPAPSLYGPSSSFFARPVIVPSCVRYSTVDSRILMAGYDDGSLRLYLHTDDAPQLSIPLSNHCITDMRFSGCDKWFLWVLDASGTIFLLDLAKKDKEFPVLSQPLLHTETGTCTCFDLPPDGKAENRMIVLGFEKGIIQLHTLSDLTHPTSTNRDEHWL